MKIKEIKEKVVKKSLCFFKSRYTLALLCGFFAVGALPPYSCFPCLFVAFSGLMFLLERVNTKKQASALGFCFGFGYFSLGLLWVSQALMIDGMGFEALAPLPPFGFGLWGGFFPLFACLIAYLAPKGWRRVFAFAGAWGILEWVRSWLFSGFPWNPIGSVWSDMPFMMQTASVWGVYGLSVVTILAFSLPALIKKKSLKGLAPLYFSFAILLGLGAFGLVRLHNAPPLDKAIQGISLRLVQANIPQGQKWTESKAEADLMKHVHLSRSEGAEKATHVIWPETATQYPLLNDSFARAMVTSALRPGAILLAGSFRLEEDLKANDEQSRLKFYNSVLAINDIGVHLGSYDKSHLVPFGEYAPLTNIFPFIRKLTPVGMDFSQGKGVETLDIPRTLPVGVLVCYEVIFSGSVVDDTQRPYWLLNVTNDGWYGLSAGPYQHFATAQMRAVEEGLPLARAANTGISGMIDAYGRVVASLGLNKQGVVDVGVPYRTEKPTFFANYGNKIPLALSAFFLLIAFVSLKKRSLKK